MHIAPGQYRVENPGWNDTKSAFADYAEGTLRKAGSRTGVSGNVTVPRPGGDQSAEADFVVSQPGFQPGDEADSGVTHNPIQPLGSPSDAGNGQPRTRSSRLWMRAISSGPTNGFAT